MGRVDPAVLSVRCTRGPEKSLVLLWLSTGRGRNAQRSTIIRRAFFCLLAIVAEKMDPRIAHASWFRGDGSINSCAVAAVQSRSVDSHRACDRPQLVTFSGKRIAPRRGLDRRYHRVRRVSNWCFGWRQFRLAAGRFPLRQWTLSVSFHQFLLQ